MSFGVWLLANIGRAIDVDGAYGPQCVDAVNSYLAQVYGCQPVSGDAIDIANQTIYGFSWVSNGAFNVPRAGSILVWSAGKTRRVTVGAAGHTAICVVADARSLLSVDQNWIGVRALTLTLHNYDLVLGWHHPN